MNAPEPTASGADPRAGEALVVAVDGVLAATPALRAAAVREACEAEGVPCPVERLDLWLAGRSLEEGIAALATLLAAQGGPSNAPDPALQTVLTLRAQRGYASRTALGVPVHPGVVTRLRGLVARGVRVAWRADSDRATLAWLEQEPSLAGVGTMLRAADDRPTHPGASSLVGSHRAIRARGAVWGVPEAGWWAWELPAVLARLEAEAVPVRPLPPGGGLGG